jgi:hypothetical protein
LIATSTATVLTPPVPNPCDSPAASGFAPGSRGPNGILRIVTNAPERAPQFPALLMISAAIALGLGSLGLGATLVARRKGDEWAVSAATRGRARAVFATAMICGAILLGCGKKGTNVNSTATPIAVTIMNVVASATDSSGNSINASRGLQITLDVIKQVGVGKLP